MLAVCTKILCARRAKIWKTFCKFFARFRRTICVIPTPDARGFGRRRTHGMAKSFEDVMKIGQRTLAKCTQLFCAGRAENFQEFSNFFVRFGAKFEMRDPDRRAPFQI